MKLFELTANLKDHGRYICQVAYSSIDGADIDELGFVSKPPQINDLQLISAEPIDDRGAEPIEGSKSLATLILNYAEDLILAGERL